MGEGLISPYKSFADSHLYLGLKVTKGQDFFYEGQDKSPRPYLHYPPGIGLTIWGMYHFLGYEGDLHLFVPQILPIVTHSLSFLLIFVLSLLLTHSLILAFLSLIIFTITPMSLYYGHVIEHMPISLPFILMALISYYSFLTKKQWKYIIATLISSALASFYCWTGFFILPALIIHQLIISRFHPIEKTKSFILLAIIQELAMSAFLLGQIYWADNFTFQAFSEGFSRRILGSTFENFTLLNLISVNWQFTRALFTHPLIFSGLIFLVDCLRKLIFQKKLPLSYQIAVISLFIGAAYVVVFPYNSVHEFAQFYLIPFFVLSPVLLLQEISSRYLKRKRVLFLAICLCLILLVFIDGKDTIYNHYTMNGEYPIETPLLEIFK